LGGELTLHRQEALAFFRISPAFAAAVAWAVN
jgi:hypothetical protein